MAASVPIDELPNGHLFRLLFRRFGEEENRLPVDWDAIEQRLKSHPHETRQWVKTDYVSSRLFLHELCDYEFGKDDSDVVDDDDDDGVAGAEEEDGDEYDEDATTVRRQQQHPSDTELRILQMTIDVFPKALRLRDAMGYLPLHRICIRCKNWSGPGSSHLNWYRATPKAIRTILKSYPEAASKLSHMDGKTAMHCLLEATTGEGKLDCLVELLDLFPEAVTIADEEGLYPLHVACLQGDHGIINALINRCPQAVEIRCESPYLGHRTLLQTFLQCNDEAYEQAKIILERCPWAVGIDDNQVLATYGGKLQPAGDALDYVCISYSKKVGVNFAHANVLEEVIDGTSELSKYRRGYVEANANFVKQLAMTSSPGQQDDSESFSFLLNTLRVMYGPRPFLPLHACMDGRLCRPWHLAVVQAIFKRFPDQIMERDIRGNIPLHSFLESFLFERERSIEKSFAHDEEDYHFAVNQCLAIILGFDESTVKVTNDEGRLPLHLAIEHGLDCPFNTVISQLLSLAPTTVSVPDPKTGLYPFMAAAVGMSSNLNSIYSLLKFDPNVLNLQRGSFGDEPNQPKDTA